MHGTIFSIKRANWATQKYLQQRLRGFPLTAARFDLLFAIHPHHPRDRFTHFWEKDFGVRRGKQSFCAGRGGVPQVEIPKMLGVSRQNVHRMLKELIKLGFVRREPINKRHFQVFVTHLGLRAFRVVARNLWRHITNAVRDLVVPKNGHGTGNPPGFFYVITCELMNGYQYLFGGPRLRTGPALELYKYGHPDD